MVMGHEEYENHADHHPDENIAARPFHDRRSRRTTRPVVNNFPPNPPQTRISPDKVALPGIGDCPEAAAYGAPDRVTAAGAGRRD